VTSRPRSEKRGNDDRDLIDLMLYVFKRAGKHLLIGEASISACYEAMCRVDHQSGIIWHINKSISILDSRYSE